MVIDYLLCMESRIRRKSSRLAARRVSNFHVFNTQGWDKMADLGEQVDLDKLNIGDDEVTLHVDPAGGGGGSGEGAVQVTLAQELAQVEVVEAISDPKEGGDIADNLGLAMLKVSPGPSLGSTISNYELNGEEDPGSEGWKAKKADLVAKLHRAKERERFLKEQLNVQRERVKLEEQEKENYCIESEMIMRD